MRFLTWLCLLISVSQLAAQDRKFEVWAIDQSNSPGLAYGGTLHIWDGHALQMGHEQPATSERIDLAGAVATMCREKTGVNPVRPHMLAINRSQTHGIISFVASGHVVFLNAASRAPIDCIRTSAGAGGARQVHFAIPSPDETYVSVANQNGKLFERIDTDYAANRFVLNTAVGINLVNCRTPNGVPCQDASMRPDNAPICPIIDASSRYSFVTLRGGGLFVIDSKANPMQIVAEYDQHTIHPNGCLGAQVGDKMYLDSGGGTGVNLYEADLYVLPAATGYSTLNTPNLPAPRVIFSEDVEHADSHGAALTRGNEYLWVADRGRNFIWVVETVNDTLVNRIPLDDGSHMSSDPTPDLLMTSPTGSHIFMSMRGPNPLSGDPHVSTGSAPGVGVLRVTMDGRNGYLESVAPVSNIDAGGVERADVHALAIRVVR